MPEFRLEEGDQHFQGIKAENIANLSHVWLESGDPHFVKVEGKYKEGDWIWRLFKGSKLYLNMYEAPNVIAFFFAQVFMTKMSLWSGGRKIWGVDTRHMSGDILQDFKIVVKLPNQDVYFSSGGRTGVSKRVWLVKPIYDNYVAEGDEHWIINTTKKEKYPTINFVIEEEADKFRVIRFDGSCSGSVELWGYSDVLDKELLIGKTNLLPQSFIIPPHYTKFRLYLKDNLNSNSYIILNKIVRWDTLKGVRL